MLWIVSVLWLHCGIHVCQLVYLLVCTIISIPQQSCLVLFSVAYCLHVCMTLWMYHLDSALIRNINIYVLILLFSLPLSFIYLFLSPSIFSLFHSLQSLCSYTTVGGDSISEHGSHHPSICDSHLQTTVWFIFSHNIGNIDIEIIH